MRLAPVLLLALATFAAGCASEAPAATPGEGGDEVPADGNVTRKLPEPNLFEFGPTPGCAGDAYSASGGMAPLTCASFQGGPDATGVDGHWIAVNETYWGLKMSTMVVQSPVGPQQAPVIGTVLEDTDCVVTDEDGTILADGNNGPGLCGLVVPKATAYVFVYSYGVPATEMTVKFDFPS